MLTDEEVKMLEDRYKIVKEKVKRFLRDNRDMWFTEEEIAEAIGEYEVDVYKALVDLERGYFINYVREIRVGLDRYYKYEVTIADTVLILVSVLLWMVAFAILISIGGFNG